MIKMLVLSLKVDAELNEGLLSKKQLFTATNRISNGRNFEFMGKENLPQIKIQDYLREIIYL